MKVKGSRAELLRVCLESEAVVDRSLDKYSRSLHPSVVLLLHYVTVVSLASAFHPQSESDILSHLPGLSACLRVMRE